MDKFKDAAVWVAVMLVIGIGLSVLSNAFILPDSAWLSIPKMYVKTVTTNDQDVTVNIVRRVAKTMPAEITISIYRQDNGEIPCLSISRSEVMRKGSLSYSEAVEIEGELSAGQYVAEVYVSFSVGFGIRRDVIANTSFVVVEAKDV